MAIVSILVGALIFIGKIVHRGSKTIPWTTKRYIKDQFTFVDISKLKSAVVNSIKAFVDWVFFAKETSGFEHCDKVYKSCKLYKSKIKTVQPVPYFIDEDEYGCGYYTMDFMYDISTGKLYDDEEVTSHDFIKDMLKAEDPCLIEPGNYVYIHDPRDGTDYMIAIEDLSRDEEKSKEE